jgi:hypothetical protein
MLGTFTESWQNPELDAWLGRGSYRPPAVLYVGLSTNRADRSGAVAEPQPAKGYQRVPVPNTPAQWTPARDGGKSNAQRIVFPAPTGDWGPIKSLFLADSATGGAVLLVATVPARVLEQADGPPAIAPGAFLVQTT